MIQENRVIKLSPPDITDEEIQAVVASLKSGWITTGPVTKRFEKEIAEYCGTNRAVCLNSATACLELTLRILGIGEGDEVIVPAYTYTASASVIDHVGAKIVFCDCAKDSYQMDYDLLPELITDKTKAIIAVDIAGVMCDYDRIKKIAADKADLYNPRTCMQKAFSRLPVLADAAHSIGAERDGKRSGQAADFTSFSFHAVKNVTTAEGGAVTWLPINGISDDEIYRQYMLLSLHGQNKDALAKSKLGGWEFDIECLGYKCNMTDVAAAIGSVQLKRYPKLLERRHEIARMYDVGLSGLGCKTISEYTDGSNPSHHLFLVRVNGIDSKTRDSIFYKMAEYGVATLVHYKPLPMMSGYICKGFDIKDYPNAYDQYCNEISLPIHTLMSDEDVRYVIECFKKALSEVI